MKNDSSFCSGTALQCHVESFSDLLVPWAASPLMRLHLSCSQHFYLCAGPSSAPKGAFILCLPCRMDCGVCTGHYFALFVLARFSFRVSGLIGNILFSLPITPKYGVCTVHCHAFPMAVVCFVDIQPLSLVSQNYLFSFAEPPHPHRAGLSWRFDHLCRTVFTKCLTLGSMSFASYLRARHTRRFCK